MGMVVLFHIILALKRATRRGFELEDRDSNALTVKSRQSTTSNLRSSIKVLALNLDWFPPSKMQRVSLLSPVGPTIHCALSAST
jgi:hypothetical protein